MSYMDYHLEEKLMGQRVREERHQAKLRRLGREAQKAKPSWVSRQRDRLSCQFARLNELFEFLPGQTGAVADVNQK